MSKPLTLSSLALLPLGTVLFPGGLLPLRIFEVRYLDMVGKCHKAGAPFGVVSLVRGSEVRRPGATEEFASIGTLAVIRSLEVMQPGLLALRCEGLQRFRIDRRELLKHGLWVCDVEQIAQDASVAVPEDLRHIATALTKLMTVLRHREDAVDQIPPPESWQFDDCGWVANRWCELLPLPIPAKQRLMELDNPLLRLELVGDALAHSGIAT